MKRFVIAVVALVVILVALGFLVPLQTYTTTSGCIDNVSVTDIRLALVKGETIAKARAANDATTYSIVGCRAASKYSLYLF